jgi:hypothetical protein
MSKSSNAQNKVARKMPLPEPITDKKLLKKMIISIRKARRKASIIFLRLYLTKNWKALGYDSFKDFLAKELPEYNYETVLSWIVCDKILFELAGEGAVGVYSLNSIRQFKGLTPQQQRELWESLRESAQKNNHAGRITSKWLTASRVKEQKIKLFGEVQKQQIPAEVVSDHRYEQPEPDYDDTIAVTGTPVNTAPSPIISKRGNRSNESEEEVRDDSVNVESNVVNINKRSKTRIKDHKKLVSRLENYDGSSALSKIIVDFTLEAFNIETISKMINYLNKKLPKIQMTQKS